jgi:hypothetical protein
VPDVPSIAEGVGGMVEEDCITLPYLKKYADDFLLVILVFYIKLVNSYVCFINF